MLRATITASGKWLAPGAAASWLRMVAASGDLSGLVAAGRTHAEQEARYKAYLAGGNLAAPPGHSLHELGQAIDVTRRSPLQLWMTAGGDHAAVLVQITIPARTVTN